MARGFGKMVVVSSLLVVLILPQTVLSKDFSYWKDEWYRWKSKGKEAVLLPDCSGLFFVCY